MGMVGAFGKHVITPQELAKTNTEHGHQCAFFQWLALTGKHEIPDADLIFSVPNGGERTPSEGAKMRAEGLRPGVPDIEWAVPAGSFHGLFVEMKRPALKPRNCPPMFSPIDPVINDGLTAAQKTVARRLQAMGYAVAVAYSWLEARDAIRLYHALR